MIDDANDVPDAQAIAADICIVGAGAAGITLALELIDSGISVVVLESGGLKFDEKAQALYSGTVVDERLHSPSDRYRQRRFGGTTTIWGGRCMPLDEIDFEQRDYLPHSGWPFGLDALMPYYPKANRLCEAGAFEYSINTAFKQPMPPMLNKFSSENFSADRLERFSCPTDFGRRYGHRLAAAKNIRVLLNANVTVIGLDASGAQVSTLTAATLKGKKFQITAGTYVLATGGLEVARLLLANRQIHPRGIGNQHDQVGRYYMCHMAGTVGTLKIDGPKSAVSHGYDVSDEGIYCRRRLALEAKTQRRLGIGNFIARLHFPRITDPSHGVGILSLLFLAKMFISYEYGKRLHGGERASFGTWLKHVLNVVSDPFYTASFLWHWLRKRTLAERKFPSVIIRSPNHHYSLDFHSEQEPNPDSRVGLSDELDELGMPRIRIDWRYTEWDIVTVRKALDVFAEDVRRSGIGSYEYDAETLEAEVMRYGAYGGHHLGTARMGTDPRSSVVDADARVHGVDNLFIAGGAIFPTSGQANPTLSIVALTLKLADHLKAGFGQVQSRMSVPTINPSVSTV